MNIFIKLHSSRDAPALVLILKNPAGLFTRPVGGDVAERLANRRKQVGETLGWLIGLYVRHQTDLLLVCATAALLARRNLLGIRNVHAW